MRIDGVYVGIGEGDESDEILKIILYVRKMYTPARNTVPVGRVFTPELTAEIKREQDVFVTQGKLKAGEFIPGVINLAWKYASGYLKKDKLLPLYFSVEGHMSDMNIGPVAHIGEVLRAEGRALHFPTGYDRWSLPFKNQTGVDELARRIGSLVIHDPGMPEPVKFPKGTPWAGGFFSQGAMIWFDFYHQYLAPGKPLNWRLDDLRAAVVCGDPCREKGVVVDWIQDPPEPDRQGIMDDDNRWKDTPWWMLELARKGDLYTDNQSEGDIGLYKTSVARIITQNKWSGGPTGMLARIIDLLQPTDDLIPVTMAIIQAVMFVGNMRTHGEYPLDPAIQFVRERLAA